jgi:translation initiation factor 5A
MVLKIVNAHELRLGSYIFVDGEAFLVRTMDISKTGKHGASKCRFEAIAATTGKKRVFMCPGHERFEVPMIDKRKAQVLSLMGEIVSLMDVESFENFELAIPEELKGQLSDGANIEYWDIEGTKLLKRTN